MLGAPEAALTALRACRADTVAAGVLVRRGAGGPAPVGLEPRGHRRAAPRRPAGRRGGADPPAHPRRRRRPAAADRGARVHRRPAGGEGSARLRGRRRGTARTVATAGRARGPGQAHVPRAGVLPAGAGRASRLGLPDAQVPDHGRGRGGPAARARAPQRARRRADVQDPGRSARHAAGPGAPQVVPGRAAPADRCADRLDVPGRAPAAVAARGRALRARRAPPSARQARGSPGCGRCPAAATCRWEDTVRTDLSYVENWHLGLDLGIILRTLRAVVRRSGAY